MIEGRFKFGDGRIYCNVSTMNHMVHGCRIYRKAHGQRLGLTADE